MMYNCTRSMMTAPHKSVPLKGSLKIINSLLGTNGKIPWAIKNHIW